MRTFLAIELPKELKDYLFTLPKQIKGASVNWVYKKNLHITLNFIGELPEEKVKKIKEIIKTIKFKPFKLKLTKLGFFPNKDHLKTIWIGVEPKQLIVDLAQKIDQELMEFVKEQKFEAHITLGRFRSFKKKELFCKSVEEFDLKPLEFEVNSFQFFKSILRKEGPRHVLLENVEMS
jgi:RNA 2',3'-cyclic 3'-phosphodiesterase